jgi:hypothetical protein
MELEFFGRSRREYISKRTGEQAVAHNLAVVLPSGEVGQLYVDENVYQQTAELERGQRVILEVEATVWQGQVQLRPARLVPAV